MNIINEGYAEAEYFFKKGIGPYIFDQKNDKFLELTIHNPSSLSSKSQNV